MLRIICPYPHKVLWPNGRTRSVQNKAAQVRKHRQWGFLAATEALQGKPAPMALDAPISVRLVVNRKSSGPYPDKDNVVAAAKSYLDGIADRLNINDRLFCAPEVEFDTACTGLFTFEIGEPHGLS